VKIKIFFSILCMMFLPLLSSHAGDGKSSNPVPFDTLAFAGHVVGTGYYCTCGCPQCVCDPGEVALDCGSGMRAQGTSDANSATAESSDIDIGSGALLILFAALLLLRR